MRGIIMYDNGRLKTGRVSLIFFLCLILGFGLLFRLHKPVDKAVVVVRHIFAAAPEADIEKTPLEEPEKPSPQLQQESVKLLENPPIDKVKEVKKVKEVEKVKEVKKIEEIIEAEEIEEIVEVEEIIEVKEIKAVEEKSEILSAKPTPAQSRPDKSEPKKKEKSQPTKLAAKTITKPEPIPEVVVTVSVNEGAKTENLKVKAPLKEPIVEKPIVEALPEMPKVEKMVVADRSEKPEMEIPPAIKLVTPEPLPVSLPEPLTETASSQIEEVEAPQVMIDVAETTVVKPSIEVEPKVRPTPIPIFAESDPVEKIESWLNVKPVVKAENRGKRIEKIEKKVAAIAPVKMEPEELVVDHLRKWYEPVKKEKPTVNLMSRTEQQHLRKILSRSSAPVAPIKSHNFTAVRIAPPKSAELKVKPEKSPEKRIERSNVRLAIAVVGAGKPVEPKSITVEKKEYAALNRAWRAVGKSENDDARLIPLRIENLRSAYNFLQMKAVAILGNDVCFDLSDGSRIPAASLDRFSSIVMRVDDPWQKWGPELRQAGLRPGQSFKVRYYLYDFVRRSIYARVNQAYNWTLAKGLLKAGTRSDDIDILGRAYVVKRSGGGSFGVFVPLLVATRDGRTVDVDPLCFSNAPDIAALHAAGII